MNGFDCWDLHIVKNSLALGTKVICRIMRRIHFIIFLSSLSLHRNYWSDIPLLWELTAIGYEMIRSLTILYLWTFQWNRLRKDETKNEIAIIEMATIELILQSRGQNLPDIDIRAIDEKEKVVLSMTRSIQEYWPDEEPISGYIHVMVANLPKETFVSQTNIRIPNFETSVNIAIPGQRVYVPEGAFFALPSWDESSPSGPTRLARAKECKYCEKMHTGPCVCVTCKRFHYTDRHDYPHTWGCICAICNKDNLHNGWHYCTPINKELWRDNFENWKSGDFEVDKLIQDSQLNANEIDELMEWIEYSNFVDVEKIGEGAWGPTKVVIKKLKGGSSQSTDFLTEVSYNLRLGSKADVSRIYGLTFDSATQGYGMEPELQPKNYPPKRLLPSGPTLCTTRWELHRVISDFGLCTPADKSSLDNGIYGVLPFMAPEVLRGRKHTKASDIYGFGMGAARSTIYATVLQKINGAVLIMPLISEEQEKQWREQLLDRDTTASLQQMSLCSTLISIDSSSLEQNKEYPSNKFDINDSTEFALNTEFINRINNRQMSTKTNLHDFPRSSKNYGGVVPVNRLFTNPITDIHTFLVPSVSAITLLPPKYT
ncbi:kinase-like domain-containing protein [Rhizophagus clarus]|uniref:Kinase-like domain-containing protein n=1 Tax=Rhizophagus clarus TaxID=94130 RepID=A0A8H3LYI9_9GLOM|nr:kinase-like domain-containing protein [Rhizophagus clarus]